jgi:DNA-binding SARP family transcriptional activator
LSDLRLSLFAKFQAWTDGRPLEGLHAPKVLELFCYLLLYRDRPHAREALAALQWADRPTVQAKKYLRQALWQIQTALEAGGGGGPPLLLIDAEWVQVNPRAEFWLDVAAFEGAFAGARNVAGWQLDGPAAAALEEAVELYQGDLLEGCYQDWCLFERERLQGIYLAMLDKLIARCEARHEYQAGLAYGSRILRYDRARERTHRRLMRLHYLANNRTGALRQYERCVQALKEELSVGPSRRTAALYEQIRADRLESGAAAGVASAAGQAPEAPPTLFEVLGRLKELQAGLDQVQQEIQRVELALQE